MPKYRAAVIGLGWTGLLYDLAERSSEKFHVDDVDRPTPPLEVHRPFYNSPNPGSDRYPTTYCEALWNRPGIDLVAAADRDRTRLDVFTERYGVRDVYTDAGQMLSEQRPQIVAICTNAKGRADLTCLAVKHGVRGILTEKPMAHSLEEADRMVRVCAEAAVPLCCGAISTTDPSFSAARELVRGGAIGEVVSMEAAAPSAQHQNWAYFLAGDLAWVVGSGDEARRESGSDEFRGQGFIVAEDGLCVHFRHGAPQLRVSGTEGEISFDPRTGWSLVQATGTGKARQPEPCPWPVTQFKPPYGAVHCLTDILDCLEGRLDEPKNSGRCVATALEVEVALKLSSARGGARVDLPLTDRAAGLNYDWFR